MESLIISHNIFYYCFVKIQKDGQNNNKKKQNFCIFVSFVNNHFSHQQLYSSIDIVFYENVQDSNIFSNYRIIEREKRNYSPFIFNFLVAKHP